MTINTQWFIERLADAQMSQRGLAKAIQMDAAAVSLMLRGKRRMQINEAAEIARTLHLQLSDVLLHAGLHAGEAAGLVAPTKKAATGGRSSMVPLAYVIDGTAELRPIEPESRVELCSDLPPDAVAAQARTAMSPLQSMDRWLIAFRRRSTHDPISESIDRYCVVQLDDGRMTFGYLRPGYTSGRYIIHGTGRDGVEVAVAWAEPVLIIKP